MKNRAKCETAAQEDSVVCMRGIGQALLLGALLINLSIQVLGEVSRRIVAVECSSPIRCSTISK